ncbi:uncharacterized protein LOC114305893 [Camellia sinensis]|uniref:uncharacterized protein LOC114305893 n=1 Tax=Camellia sinensis TaxID=4442 RepID=UPI0010363CCD|nr:uncharacterized protein LOC114305893 [Camellia sinensis]
MKILSWNVRGLGRPGKRRKIRKILHDKAVDMALLQETKQSCVAHLRVKSLWPRDKMEFMTVDAAGLSGGLICIWDPDVFHLSDCCSSRNFILLSGKVHNFFDCVLVNVYALNDVSRRQALWVTLLNLKTIFVNPWCLGGDFNEIRNVRERIGVSRRDRGMQEFNDFIDNYEVVDVQMLGKKFTWCNTLEGKKWSRIDRFLLNPKWLVRYKLKLWGLPRTISGHCPLLLMEDGSILKRKLQSLKLALKKWNQETYGNVAKKLEASETALHDLDLKAETRPLDEDELMLQREKRNEMWSLSRKME